MPGRSGSSRMRSARGWAEVIGLYRPGAEVERSSRLAGILTGAGAGRPVKVPVRWDGAEGGAVPRECRDAPRGVSGSSPRQLPPHGASLPVYLSTAGQSGGDCSPVALVNISLMILYSSGVPPCQRSFEQLATLQPPPCVLNSTLSYVMGQVQCARDGSFWSMMQG